MNRLGARSLVVALGVLYATVGVITAELARQAASHDAVVAWRWVAWVVSAVMFGAHTVYEQLGLRSSTTRTARHVAYGTALGACGLALAANIHGAAVTPGGPPPLLVLSLVLWPALVGLPSFVVALVAATLLARVWRRQP